MIKVPAIGIQNFKSIIERNVLYVDKTELIKEWWESQDDVTLIARPRRFGKTLTMSMLQYFFSNKHADEGKLFEGLKIWEYEEYRTLQGTYPVISLTFSSIKEDCFENVLIRLKTMIASLYETNRFLIEGDCLSHAEKKHFEQVCDKAIEDAEYVDSINKLSEYLYRYYGKKVIILLDEYDTPLQEAYVYGYWDKMSGFIRGFFNATLKANEYFERALLTGITRVSKESIFSDLNNLKVVTISSEKYCDKYGFTTEDVAKLLQTYSLTDNTDEVKYWYDGFIFGENTIIYNPWSIINYISEKEFKPYWANTSSNSLIGQLMRAGDKDIKQKLEDLISGESICVKVDEQVVFNQLETNRDAVWSLMLATGYLKIMERDSVTSIYNLKITNFETLVMFRNMISGWFNQEGSYNEFVKAMITGDDESMNEYMNRVVLNMVSYFDSGKMPSAASEPERFYHGLTLGLMVDLSDRYNITSNRESGFGRYDIMLEPKNKADAGIIIEFKVKHPTKDKTLQDAAQAALKQIEEKQYATAFEAKGIKNIRKYGFAFEGKHVLIVE